MEPKQQHPSGVPRNQGGKACISCARIKCKCVPRLDSTSCERCYRLGKTCEPAGPAKRRGPKSHGPGSRSSRLEKKLDNLVSLLAAKQIPVDQIEGNHGRYGSEEVDLDLDDDRSVPSSTMISTPASSDIGPEELSPLESEAALQRFREEMICYCPFTFISPDTTYVQLRQTYPFLWLNIMSVSAKSLKTRNAFRTRAKNIIVQKIVLDSERSLDLLLGLLVFITWLQMFPANKKFMSLISQLAVVLVWDLGLHLSPTENTAKFPSVAQLPGVPAPLLSKERTNEERRAVLGAFVITSITSFVFKSAGGLRWSPHFDDYLTHLAQSTTLPQDHILIAQVKMQIIVEQVRHSLSTNSNWDVPSSYLDLLQSQLNDIISTFNRSNKVLNDDLIILGFYHFTTLIIHESTLARLSTPCNEPDFKQHEIYQVCLNSIKVLTDTYFSRPLDKFSVLPCMVYSQLFHAVICLHRITTSKNVTWDPAAARKAVDPITVLERMMEVFSQLNALYKANSPDGYEHEALVSAISRIDSLKTDWLNDMASKEGAQNEVHDSTMSDGLRSFSPDFSTDLFGLNMLPGLFDDLLWPMTDTPTIALSG